MTPSVITEAIVTHKIKVYVLFQAEGSGSPYINKIIGVVTDEEIVKRFKKAGTALYQEMYLSDAEEFILNDKELLNRIAKESENKR